MTTVFPGSYLGGNVSLRESSVHTHIIMTRFNLATPGREFALRTQPGWLAERFDLFERYCLPSIAAQTTRDFHWIIYFDEATPDVFRERVEAARKVFPFVPYYTGLFPSTGWRDSVLETFSPKTRLLLTTRLDNDDALANDFVARLHDWVEANDHRLGAYNFQNGLIRQGSAVYAIKHRSNAFFSWLEDVSPELRTAPSIQHMKIAQEGPVFQKSGEPGWMQVVHESNVSNKVRGWRVPPAAAKDFPPSAQMGLADVPALVRGAENLLIGVLRSGRDVILGLRRH